jgi:hypothetical protein
MSIDSSNEVVSSTRSLLIGYTGENSCATVSLAEAARVIGIHRSTAWDLHKRGEFPIPVLRVGHGLRVAKIHLERFLFAGEVSFDAQETGPTSRVSLSEESSD